MTSLGPLQEADVDAVVGVYREAWGESHPIDAAELLSWIHHPEIDPECLRALESNERRAHERLAEILSTPVRPHADGLHLAAAEASTPSTTTRRSPCASNETQAVRLYERVGMRIVRQADSWALDI